MIQVAAAAAEWRSVSVRIPRRISPPLNEVAHGSVATQRLPELFKACAGVLAGTQRKDQRGDAPEHITAGELCSSCRVKLYRHNSSKQNSKCIGKKGNEATKNMKLGKTEVTNDEHLFSNFKCVQLILNLLSIFMLSATVLHDGN